MNDGQIVSNFFYGINDSLPMFTQKGNDIVEELSRWAQSIGINLDRDPEQV